jgi:hypothetical protein
VSIPPEPTQRQPCLDMALAGIPPEPTHRQPCLDKALAGIPPEPTQRQPCLDKALAGSGLDKALAGIPPEPTQRQPCLDKALAGWARTPLGPTKLAQEGPMAITAVIRVMDLEVGLILEQEWRHRERRV